MSDDLNNVTLTPDHIQTIQLDPGTVVGYFTPCENSAWTAISAGRAEKNGQGGEYKGDAYIKIEVVKGPTTGVRQADNKFEAPARDNNFGVTTKCSSYFLKGEIYRIEAAGGMENGSYLLGKSNLTMTKEP